MQLLQNRMQLLHSEQACSTGAHLIQRLDLSNNQLGTIGVKISEVVILTICCEKHSVTCFIDHSCSAVLTYGLSIITSCYGLGWVSFVFQVFGFLCEVGGKLLE